MPALQAKDHELKPQNYQKKKKSWILQIQWPSRGLVQGNGREYQPVVNRQVWGHGQGPWCCIECPLLCTQLSGQGCTQSLWWGRLTRQQLSVQSLLPDSQLPQSHLEPAVMPQSLQLGLCPSCYGEQVCPFQTPCRSLVVFLQSRPAAHLFWLLTHSENPHAPLPTSTPTSWGSYFCLPEPSRRAFWLRTRLLRVLRLPFCMTTARVSHRLDGAQDWAEHKARPCDERPAFWGCCWGSWPEWDSQPLKFGWLKEVTNIGTEMRTNPMRLD
jgi:hypothetical protein